MRNQVLTLGCAAGIAALTIVASAQGPQPQQKAPADPTLERVNAVANALGMLRGLQLRDGILTVTYSGTGSVRGTPVTSYKAEIAYDAPGMRVEIDRKAAPQKQIVVVSGRHAWNESEAGAGLVAGKGTATPAMDAWADRNLELWMMPHAFVKAARIPDNGTKIGTEAGATVITTNVPGMPGVTMKATLNAKNLIDRVESRLGDAVVEAAYSDYKDIGGVEHPSDIAFPGRIVRKVGVQTVLDLTVTAGNTYNPYVIVPVPENVGKVAP
jgi:hypothetical protein